MMQAAYQLIVAIVGLTLASFFVRDAFTADRSIPEKVIFGAFAALIVFFTLCAATGTVVHVQ